MAALAARSSTTVGTTAPWKALFLSHVSKLSSPEFVLSSLHPDREPESSAAAVGSAPRARYLVFRGMWAELPDNRHNDAAKNEAIYESALPTFTTDMRMEKVPEFLASSAGHGAAPQSQASGGGGPVEAVFWVKEAMTQWRMRGQAFVVGPDIEGDIEGDGDGEASSGVRTVKREVGQRMRLLHPGREADWSWTRELTAHFGNLNPTMRGTFKNPPPGTPVAAPVSDPGLSLGQAVSDLDDPIARRNFRVVVITPMVVEQLDLSAPDTARRWRFTFIGRETAGEQEQAQELRAGEMLGEWKREELWP
ncbi:MAG: hypothetical protein M1826_004875 [Phylliscum demangeonii]|nr:MAG: hypothetical protein M1826_004875 [Phylliscum demangeonii]